MAVRATDNENLARQTWGEDYHWDEQREQFVPGAQAEPDATESSVDKPEPYADVDFKDLKVQAKERGLVATGTRDELVARLIEADAAKAAQDAGA